MEPDQPGFCRATSRDHGQPACQVERFGSALCRQAGPKERAPRAVAVTSGPCLSVTSTSLHSPSARRPHVAVGKSRRARRCEGRVLMLNVQKPGRERFQGDDVGQRSSSPPALAASPSGGRGRRSQSGSAARPEILLDGGVRNLKCARREKFSAAHPGQAWCVRASPHGRGGS